MTTQSPKRHARRIKLIEPALQLRLVLTFAGVAALALLTEFLLLAARLTSFAADMPSGGDYLASEMPGLLWGIVAFSFGVLLPTIIGIGILITFRLAGPIYRFKQHLRAVADGKRPGRCHIRKNDELEDLCELINLAIDKARQEGPLEAPAEPGEQAA